MRKQTAKQREQQIAAIIQNSVYGWSIPMMKISEIYRAGQAAASDPIDETAIRAAVIAKLELWAVRS